MFAQYTPTRMRGSGVVQSLKSWASKLHPQLPLSHRESQRLLTALTSSFRQHLDQAHPQRVESEHAKGGPGNGTPSKLGIRSVHASSVHWADKHLASVLTSPLLTEDPDSSVSSLAYKLAMKSLSENPRQDPAALLEEYHQNGVATIPIAALCLEKFKERLAAIMDEDKRQELIHYMRAGSRTLHWLWKSGLHDTPGFVDNTRLMHAMVPLIIQEGQEEMLWKWFHEDEILGGTTTKKDFGRQKHHDLRWRSRLLGCMTDFKMDNAKNESADAALDAVIRASSATSYIPNVPATKSIDLRLRRHSESFSKTSVEKYDKFRAIVMDTHRTTGLMARSGDAELTLYHPSAPSPLGLFNVLKLIFDPDAKHIPGVGLLLDRIERPKDSASQTSWSMKMARVAVLFELEGKDVERKWMISQMARLNPDWYPTIINSHLKTQRIRLGPGRAKTFADPPSAPSVSTNPVRRPFPTFDTPSADATPPPSKASPKSVRTPHSPSTVGRHSASPFASPLLTRSYGTRALKLDYESAQKSLLEDPTQDPASFIEDYHDNGVATVPIAALCLEKFVERLNRMNAPERTRVVSETKAGSRTMVWLWKSELHDTSAFVDDLRMKQVLIPLVMEEGQEELLWKWLEQDMKLAAQDSYDLQLGWNKRRAYEYRWKGRMLSEMVNYRLAAKTDTKSADSALDILFRAINSKTWFPLVAPTIPIIKAFYDGHDLSNTDTAKFERFYDLQSDTRVWGNFSDLMFQLRQSDLRMHHPTSPSPWEFLKLLKRLFEPNTQDTIPWITKPRTGSERAAAANKMAMAAVLLELEDCDTEKEWVLELIRLINPNWPHRVITALLDEARMKLRRPENRSSQDIRPAARQRIPFPTFD